MAGSNPSPSSSRGPAVFVGGQRRRLVRRSNLPRSNTAPVLGPESATANLVSSASGVATSLDADANREQGAGGAIPQGPSSTMNFYPPTAGIPTDFRPSPKSRPSTSSNTSVPAAESPTPTTPSEGKKKHGLFDGLKSKDRDRPDSSHASPLPTSPLPPVTPCKAAQVLGLGPDTPTIGSVRGNHSQHDGVQDGPPVRLMLKKQSSMPLLTKIKDVALNRQTKFREEGVEPDPPKSKKFPWASGNKKAMKMLDLIPSLGSSSKRATSQEHLAASHSPSHLEEDAKDSYSSETDNYAGQPLIPAVPRPISQRRMRKKGPKSLDRMSPITEASYDDHGAAHRNSEYNTELDVISEYEHDYPSHSAPILPRSRTESMLTTNVRYELDDDDLSPEDEDDEIEEAEQVIHPGTQVDINRVKRQQPAVVHVRGPLQTVEDRLLDVAEMDLEANKVTLTKCDTAKLELDTETAMLRASHEKMKKDFGALKQRATNNDESDHTHQHHICDIEGTEDDEDLVSLRSSIDLDEEPTVHIAKVMTFTRITPGMVKMVDIPPRKKKPNPPVDAPVVSAEVKSAEANPKFFYEHDEKISPFNERSKNLGPMIEPGYLQATNYNRPTKARKAKMPREESRMLVQDWIASSPRPAELRPVSERLDLDVLADQQIPPAPFPKENRPTPPPKLPSKRFCINNGHDFHHVDLKQVPNEVAINSLEVRPYLQTSKGVKQHVHVPFICEKCGGDVKEELWECEIAVCRMVVCKGCAEDMGKEWQETAVGSWAC